MSASAVLQRCLKDALGAMHALRRTALMLAVESLVAGRRLVLMRLRYRLPGFPPDEIGAQTHRPKAKRAGSGRYSIRR
jgi:hypothetical protein